MSVDKISVLMSVYNESENVLRESIYSILNQTYKNIEFIIINDNPCRSENTNVLKGIEDSRVQIIVNECNKGLVSSLNTALRKATGDYIARMDADDISYENRLEKELEYLKKESMDIVGCFIELIDEKDEKLGIVQKFPITHKDFIRVNRWRQGIAHPTFLAKRGVYEDLKGYRCFDYCEDYDFVTRAVYKGYKVGNIPEVLLKYRIRSDSITNERIYEQKVRSHYIGHLKEKILLINEFDIKRYIESSEYKEEVALCKRYFEGKKVLFGKKENVPFYKGLSMILNKYLLYGLMRHIV